MSLRYSLVLFSAHKVGSYRPNAIQLFDKKLGVQHLAQEDSQGTPYVGCIPIPTGTDPDNFLNSLHGEQAITMISSEDMAGLISHVESHATMPQPYKQTLMWFLGEVL